MILEITLILHSVLQERSKGSKERLICTNPTTAGQDGRRGDLQGGEAKAGSSHTQEYGPDGLGQ